MQTDGGVTPTRAAPGASAGIVRTWTDYPEPGLAPGARVCVGGGREVCEHPGQGGFKCGQCARGSVALLWGCSERSIAGASRQDLGFLLARETQRVLPAPLQTLKAHAITCMVVAPGGY